MSILFILYKSITICAAIGGTPWYSCLSPEPVTGILLTTIADCYVYTITGLQVMAGHSHRGVRSVRTYFMRVPAIW
jgi:hypothetical protein